MRTNQGFPFIELGIAVAVLGLLAVVAVPRPIEKHHEGEADYYEKVSIKYMSSLHDRLASHVADHYTYGTEWVKDGKEIMAALDEEGAMPENMHYANNVWTDNESGIQWEFQPAKERSTPRIKRLPPKHQSKIWD